MSRNTSLVNPMKSFAFVAATAAMVMSAACGSDQPGLTGQIEADGSSTVFPLTTAVTEEFLKIHPAVKIAVAVSGTSGGFEKFCTGDTDIQNASRPIAASEVSACEKNGVTFLEVPVAYDAVTVIVHPQNTWATAMTLAELRRLWEPKAQGTVMRWSDVRAEWPGEPIHLFGPGPASGTFDHFTEAVVGTSRASRTDYTASEDDTVITKGVAADMHALGYVGYGYFRQNENTLKSVSLARQDGPVGDASVAPSPDTVRRGLYRPLSRTLFIYVNAKSIDRPEVKAFVDFYLRQDEALIDRVGGIGMSSRTYELVRARLEKRAAGTLFADRSRLDRNLELVLAEER